MITAGKKFDMMAYPLRKCGISDEAAMLHLYRYDDRFLESESLAVT